MKKRVVIIGAGPGGYVAAVRAAQLGAQVTIIEKEEVGGTCLHWGCIPSKVMKTTAELISRIHRAEEFGIKIKGEMAPDLKGLQERKRRVIQDQVKGIVRLLDHQKIDLIRGAATIEEREHVTVRENDGGVTRVPWDRLILALGSRPLDLPGIPFDGIRILSSNDALEMEELPKSLMIVGGGVIGCEFGSIFSCLGSQVTIVEAMDRLLPLPSLDGDCSKLIQREMKKRKIKFHLNTQVEDISEVKERVQVRLAPFSQGKETRNGAKKSETVEVDKVIICVGRKSQASDVGLETLGMELDERGWIVADSYLRLPVDGIYAIGDALGPSRPMLAHVASREGIIAAENAMGANQAMNYDIVPGAIFTMPEVAHVGLTEVQAKKQGYRVRSDKVLFRNLGKSQVIGEIAGEAKIVSDEEGGKILGVHMVGPHATDLLAEGALAMNMGGTVKDLADTIHAHPTLSEIMMEVALKAMDRSLHG
jgi:dihydrolipoamide dehydrogenase